MSHWEWCRHSSTLLTLGKWTSGKDGLLCLSLGTAVVQAQLLRLACRCVSTSARIRARVRACVLVPESVRGGKRERMCTCTLTAFGLAGARVMGDLFHRSSLEDIRSFDSWRCG